ncbi:polysaccharide lyase 8 family protein [Paenibacillus sp. YN15]|uniref:polysaccharide lyase 8 family protein n=1 Tax=Paenibacillus sp. YN15 TaxID=1742774 RepID=UPI0015ECB814|nr:polysaccharide lyase 8 family protein [Paenibacillus sp. YN15]
MEFDVLLAKWRRMVTGGPLPSSGEELSPFRSGTTVRLTEKARWNRDTMDLQQDNGLWPDLAGSKDARHIHQTYLRLKEMAIAYETEGSALYQNAELSQAVRQGLERAYQILYNERTVIYGNWWNWEIGVPLSLLDTLVLMRQQLSSGLVASCLRAVDRCTPNPEWQLVTVKPNPHPSTGANRVWKSRVCLFSALLKRDSAAMASSCKALSPVFEYVEEGDGFYEDGSFIQHKRFPYTGGYGKALLKELSELLYWLNGSAWEIPHEDMRNVYRWVEEAYEPLMYKGLMADMVRGREVSRCAHQNIHSGHTVLDGVLRLIDIAPAETAERLKRMAKTWIMANTGKSYLAEAPLDLANSAWSLLNDTSVEPRGDYLISKVFARMDRVIHQCSGFAFGISMFSSRIAAYESINGENLHGWHTAHGMTYLYNDDLGQYSDGFWPTVNPYRLPGTTVSTRVRSNGEGTGMSPQPFAGGAVLHGLYSAAGMELEEPGQFRARKSWFLFDDVLIALGSGIRSEAGLQLETTVDSRMLSRSGADAVRVGEDGRIRLLDAEEEVNTLKPRWVHLEGRVPGADVGYVFPRRQAVHILREARTGRWNDIDEHGPSEELTRRYLTLWIDHGLEPDGAEYAYAVLPGWSAAQTAAYAENGGAEIIELSGEVHAVRLCRLGLMGLMFWEDGERKAGPVACNRKAALLVRDEGASIAVSVADPTMENEGFVAVELDACASGVIAGDERITVHRLEPSIRFTVNVNGAKGRSCTVVFATGLLSERASQVE